MIHGKSKFIFILVFGIFFVFGLRTILMQKKLLVGVYKTKTEATFTSGISIQEVFASWTDSEDEIANKVKFASQNGRVPMLTLEPWSAFKESSANELLKNITDNRYDTIISGICSRFQNETLWIRFGHEMELPDSRYPWTNGDPALYRSAYIHFVTFCKSYSRNASFVWSPSGESMLSNYWPGSQFVDYIGLSVYAFKEWELANIGHVRSFSEILTPKYKRVVVYGKPIVISEMGVSGTKLEQGAWITNMGTSLWQFPSLIAIVYFDATDTPGAWGVNYGTADFRFDPLSLTDLLSHYLQKGLSQSTGL